VALPALCGRATGDDDKEGDVKKPPPKRLTTTQLTLRTLARTYRQSEKMLAVMRDIAEFATRPPESAPTRSGPARFIQCWTAQRGSYAVLHALDEDGQVWELHSVFDTATKQVTEQWWTPLGMERRKT